MLIAKPFEANTQGVLNLVYASQGGVEQAASATYWFQHVALGNEIVQNYPVYEWATLYKPKEFYKEIILPNSTMFKMRPLTHWRDFCTNDH